MGPKLFAIEKLNGSRLMNSRTVNAGLRQRDVAEVGSLAWHLSPSPVAHRRL
jgi:hypothetical protein